MDFRQEEDQESITYGSEGTWKRRIRDRSSERATTNVPWAWVIGLEADDDRGACAKRHQQTE